MAGKPFVYDDFRAEMIVATGASHGLDERGFVVGVLDHRHDPAVANLFELGFGKRPGEEWARRVALSHEFVASLRAL